MCQARQASWSLQMLFPLPGTPFLCSSAWQRPGMSCGLWKATSSGRSPLALLGRFRHPFSCEPSVFCPCSPCSIYHAVRSLQVCFLVRLWILLFYWSIIDLQHCLSFWRTAKWLSYTYLHAYTYSFSFSFPLWFITGFWTHSRCCKVGPCCLCILNIVVFICSSWIPNLSLPTLSPLVTINLFSICLCVHVKSLQSCLTLCDPMDCSPPGCSVLGFSRQEYWSGLSCPPSGDLPSSGTEPVSLTSPALAGRFFTTRHHLWVYFYFVDKFICIILPVSDIIWYLSFSFWFTSLSMIVSRSVYVAASGIISFFLMVEQYSIVLT